MRFLEVPAARRLRAGKRALLVTKQHALHQLLRNRGAVDRHERPLGAARQVVQRTGDHFFAGARFPAQQYRVVGRRVELHALHHFGARRGAGHQCVVRCGGRGLTHQQTLHQHPVADRGCQHAADKCDPLQVLCREHRAITRAVGVNHSQHFAE